MMQETAVQHQFTMDPNLLVSVIKSQAGTLSKALLEGVMNSVDAGAPRVDITLDEKRFVIEDSGRGFSSEEEIRNWFGRFGTPHKEGDAIFGRFRMGRGQMFAFARTIWRSGYFEMEVDLEKRGLTYELRRHETYVKGCRIEGHLYKALGAVELHDTLTELRMYVAYMPVPVYVNNELYGASPARLKSWTYEDDYAYYKLVPQSDDLQVYNQGAFVQNISAWRVGRGGVVVSKKPLEVNFARNAIMENQCNVWQHIRKTLAALVVENLAKSKNLTENDRKFLARQLDRLEKFADWLNLGKVKLLTDPSGKHLEMQELRKYKKFVYLSEEKSSLACAVHGNQGVFVVTDRLLNRFGCHDLNEWLNLLAEYTTFLPERYEVIAEDDIAHMGLSGSLSLDPDGLSRKERAAFETLKWLNEEVASALGVPSRTLLPGKHKSNAFVAWTDGKKSIWASKPHMRLLEEGLPGAHEWLMTLVHEYQHDSDDSESHAHTEVFYRKFHDTLFNCNVLGLLPQKTLVKYLQELQRQGLAKPQSLTRQLKPLAQKEST